MHVVWHNGGDEANTADAYATLGTGPDEHRWDAGNDWRLPVTDFDDATWRQLPLVGGLHLEHEDGTAVPLSTERPEVP